MSGRARLLGACALGVNLACATPEPGPTATAISVEAVDYAFQLPDTLHAGPVTVRLHNGGKVPHEMGMALLKAGVTVTQVLEHIGAGGSPDSLLDGFVGILIAGPGKVAEGALAVDLQPGRTYMLFCNFQDAPDKPEHMALGMFSGRTISIAP